MDNSKQTSGPDTGKPYPINTAQSRSLLLYGAPGAGKSMNAQILLSSMHQVTAKFPSFKKACIMVYENKHPIYDNSLESFFSSIENTGKTRTCDSIL